MKPLKIFFIFVLIFSVVGFVNATSTNSSSWTSEVTSNSSGGSSGGTSSSWRTYIVFSNSMTESYWEKDLSVRDRVKITDITTNLQYYLGVIDLTPSTAIIEINSAQNVTFNIEDEKKFDLDGDGNNDLYIKLNSISNNVANIYLKWLSPSAQWITCNHDGITENITLDEGKNVRDYCNGRNVIDEQNTWTNFDCIAYQVMGVDLPSWDICRWSNELPITEQPVSTEVNGTYLCETCSELCQLINQSESSCGQCACPENLGFCLYSGIRDILNETSAYCFKGLWLSQKEVNASCQNNFECLTNLCVNSRCYTPTDASEIQNNLTTTQEKVENLTKQINETNNQVENLSGQVNQINSNLTGINDRLTKQEGLIQKIINFLKRFFGFR